MTAEQAHGFNVAESLRSDAMLVTAAATQATPRRLDLVLASTPVRLAFCALYPGLSTPADTEAP